MKIAFVNQPWNNAVPPIQSGSLAIWTYQVARRLAKSCRVIVYGKKNYGGDKQKWDEGVLYRYIRIGFEIRFIKYMNKFSRFFNIKRPFFASTIYYLGYILKVANDLRKYQYDIVHIWNFSQFIPIIHAFNPKIKIVLHMQCEWLTQLDKSMIEKRLKYVDLIIGCSNYISSKIRKTFPLIAHRCHTIYNGVAVDHFSPINKKSTINNNKIQLLYVGRVSPEKGVHVLLEAFAKIIIKYPNAHINIIGPQGAMPIEFGVALSDDPTISKLTDFYCGDYLSYLREKLSTDIGKRVTFTGPIDYTDLVNHYRKADIFIFPSVWHEPFGMPIVEAMACGVPVIATRGGGITEIIEDHKTGLLVERSDVSGIANAIIQLLENKKLRDSIVKFARSRVSHLFSWDRISNNLLHQYKSILCKRIN